MYCLSNNILLIVTASSLESISGFISALSLVNPVRPVTYENMVSRTSSARQLFHTSYQISGYQRDENLPLFSTKEEEETGLVRDERLQDNNVDGSFGLVNQTIPIDTTTSINTPHIQRSLLAKLKTRLARQLNYLKSFNRESLSKFGTSALLAYGFVSNVSGVLAVSCAWFLFSKRTGLSPISPGQRTPFLALYAGFTVALNILRPARFALSMAISPYFEGLRNSIQRKLGVSARVSSLVMLLTVNILGTCTLMALGVGLASALSGVPVWRVGK